MTESRLQAENKELREQVEDLNNENIMLKSRVEDMGLRIDDLIEENHQLVDTIFQKQAIIDELEKTK